MVELSGLVPLGLDEMNCRKGDCNLTVFCDLVARLVGFATAGNDHTTFTRFAWESQGDHGGRR